MVLPSIPDEIDRLFDELIRRPWGTAARHLVPAELRAVDDGWIVELPVEGMRAADLRVEVQGRRLTVTGHRHHERERRHGKFSWSRAEQDVSLQRTITLPADANPDDIETKIEGSMLSIHIRKKRP